MSKQAIYTDALRVYNYAVSANIDYLYRSYRGQLIGMANAATSLGEYEVASYIDSLLDSLNEIQ